MTLSMYSASVPVFKQMLGGLSQVLSKAEAQAAENKIDPNAYLLARLYPDMFHLTRQVQVACDFAKSVTARLAEVPVPAYDDNEASFADLQVRISKTLEFIGGLKPEQIDGSEARQIVTQAGTPKEKIFDGMTYLLHYGLPHFYFHVGSAYGILRHNGVAVGKKDYVGSY